MMTMTTAMCIGMMTWLLLLFGMYAVTFKLVVPWLGWSPLGLVLILLFNFLSLLAVFSHITAMTTDPGAGVTCSVADSYPSRLSFSALANDTRLQYPREQGPLGQTTPSSIERVTKSYTMINSDSFANAVKVVSSIILVLYWY